MRNIKKIILIVVLVLIITSCSEKLETVDTSKQINEVEVLTEQDTESEPTVIIAKATNIVEPIRFQYEDQLKTSETPFAITESLIGLNTEYGIRLFGNQEGFLRNQITPELDLVNAMGISLKSYDWESYTINNEDFYGPMNFLEYSIKENNYLALFLSDSDHKAVLALEGKVFDIVELDNDSLMLIEELEDNNYKFSKLDLFFNVYNESYVQLEANLYDIEIGKSASNYQVTYEVKEEPVIKPIFIKEDKKIKNSLAKEDKVIQEEDQGNIQAEMFSGYIDDMYFIYGNYGEVDVDYREIQLYGTPFIHYVTQGIDIKLIDYRVISNEKYILEYDSNLLYSIHDDSAKLVYPESMRQYDLSKDYILYTGSTKKGLFLYSFTDDSEVMLTEDICSNLKIINDQVFFNNLSNGNFYRYDVKRQTMNQLTKTCDVSKVAYVNDWIIVQTTDKFLIMSKETMEVLDEVYGNYLLVNSSKNEIIYEQYLMLGKYKLRSEEIIRLAYTDGWYDYLDIVNDKVVVSIWEGPPNYKMINYSELDLGMGYEAYEYKLNSEFTIVDVGYMYSMAFYIYDNKTMNHDLIIDSNSEDIRIAFSTTDKEDNAVAIYHDGKYIYYQINSDDHQWIKYSPLDRNREVLEDLDSDGLEKIVGYLREP